MQNEIFKEKLKYSKEYRSKQDLRRYINQTFVDSNTYRSLDIKNKTLVQANTWWATRKVNLARPIIRSLINTITRNDPNRHPEKSRIQGKSNKEERRIANVLLKTVWKEENCKLLLKDIIRNSAIKSIGYWQIFYNQENEDSLWMCVENIDTFDVYTDPHASMKGWWIKARRVIKAIWTPASDIIEEPSYNDNKLLITWEAKLAESDRKEQIIMDDKGWAPDSSELGTAILYELYFRKRVNWKKTVHMQTFCQDYALTDEIDLWLSEFPIIPYQMERMWGRMYPTERADPVVEMNKAVNRIASSIENYVHTIAKGRYLKRRWERISTVQDQHWQFIEYDNVMPQAMQIAPMGEVPFAMLSNFERRAGDTWWSHWLSAGRATAVKTRSSKGLELLNSMDQESVSEPIDNLWIFLSNVAEMILSIASKRFNTIKKLYREDVEYPIVWEWGVDKIKWEYSEKTIKIRPFKWIQVDIVPGSVNTDMQKRQDLIALKEIWVNIPDKFIIEAFQIGNTDDILTEMMAEEEKNKNPDIDIAEAENKKMLYWQPVHADIEEDHKIHKALHAQFLQAIQGQDPMIEQLVVWHIKEHEMIEQWGQTPQYQMDAIWAEQYQPQPQQQQPQQQQPF